MVSDRKKHIRNKNKVLKKMGKLLMLLNKEK